MRALIRSLPLFSLLLSPLLLGCSGETGGEASSGAFPAEAYTTMVGEKGAVTFEIRTAPTQPPSRGLVTVEYRISDMAGAPLDGLDLQVLPWMPAMGHGASTDPSIEAKGEGRYLASKVSFFMPGSWELRSTVAGAVEDRAIVTFQIH
jgi:hypothetical protein